MASETRITEAGVAQLPIICYAEGTHPLSPQPANAEMKSKSNEPYVRDTNEASEYRGDIECSHFDI